MVMRIVVATDGQDGALGALRVARILAEQRGAEVEVVSAIPPFPFPASPVGDLTAASLQTLDRAAAAAVRARIEAHIREIEVEVGSWPIRVEVGPAPPSIVHLAQASGASLILLGHAHHPLAERIFGSETGLRVMRLAHVPVLAVPAKSDSAPRSAVVAVDFSGFSRDAALSAIGLMPTGAEVHLAHVLWRPLPQMPAVAGPAWVQSYHASARAQLDALARELAAAAEVRVELHLLEGEAAPEILGLADRVGTELIAAGSHGTGFFGRLLMGSVSTQLVRRASCAVLITPPRTVPAELEVAWQSRQTHEPHSTT